MTFFCKPSLILISQDIRMIEILPLEESWGMPLQKMRTLLALLLKKISTPGRLKKLGFGTRLIDQVSIQTVLLCQIYLLLHAF